MSHLVALGIHVDEAGEGSRGSLKEAISEHVGVELLAFCEAFVVGT